MENFTELGLSKSLVDTINKMGFVTPTPIQAMAIPKLLEETGDIVGLAQTGTGKTAAFGLPIIDLVDTNSKQTQALVMAPTRELCIQITKELTQFGSHIKKLKILAVYGGAEIRTQIKALRKGVQIIIATPGRLRDLIKRKEVDIQEIDYVVLDEADEMLNMGFKEEIDEILENTSDDKLTWLFSATMPSDVRRIAKNYMNHPTEISVRGENISNTDIDHQYVKVYPSARFDTLKRFLDFNPDTFGLIFCRTRREAKQVADDLSRDGYNADALHGELNQSQRDRVMGQFRRRRINILVATDVAARGIDVQDITHVFHFNIPDDLAFYTHRSGRTGRAGNKGISLVLAHPNDVSILRRLEKKNKIDFTESHIPTGPEICELQMMDHIKKIKEAEISDEIEEFLPTIIEEFEALSKEEIIRQLAGMSFSRIIKKYKNAPDLNPGRKKRRSFNGSDMRKLFINIGTMDVENKGQFLSMICKYGKISGHNVGRINMNRKHTYFDVDPKVADSLIKGFKNLVVDGRTIRVNDDGFQGKSNGYSKSGRGDRDRRRDGDRKHRKKDKRKKKNKYKD